MITSMFYLILFLTAMTLNEHALACICVVLVLKLGWDRARSYGD